MAGTDDRNYQIKSIIDEAINSLVTIGVPKQTALSLLAFQSVIRMQNPADVREHISAIEEWAQDHEDDDDEPEV